MGKKKKGNKNTKKDSIFSIIRNFIAVSINKVNSDSGRVNIIGGFILLVIIISLVFQPIVHYVLLAIQYFFNMILSLFTKNTISIDNEVRDLTSVIILCIILLFVESIFCTLMVRSHEKNKK